MSKIRDDFAIFILSHGRADKVYTYNALRKHGYTGEIYIVIDNEDEQIDKYIQNFGEDKVLIFDKNEAFKITDTGDNLQKKNSVVFARNYVYKIAKDIGKRYILVLDDDYTYFARRFDKDRNYITSKGEILKLDDYIKIYLDFFIEANLDCLAFAQTGDYIGGQGSAMATSFKRGELYRKAMNAFFFDVEKPIYFFGRINEDVNMYLIYNSRGYKIFTYPRVTLVQKETQQNSGGLTDIYLELGTYVKSFYSVMYMPSAVKIRKMGAKYFRLHHEVKWDKVAPKILDEKYKKR